MAPKSNKAKGSGKEDGTKKSGKKRSSLGRDIMAFVKAENKTSVGLHGESTTMVGAWDLVPDEPKKRQMEAMFKRLYAMKLDLSAARMRLVSELGCVMLQSHNASSSSEHVPVPSQNENAFVEQPERKMDEEEKDADVVLCDAANKDTTNEASVSLKEDSCVAAPGLTGQGRKILLVLDLNGLLANVVSNSPGVKADIVFGRKAIFKRPFCQDFLNFCFQKFEVGIWSSRNPDNVEKITEFLLGDLRHKLSFCWDMSHCDQTTTGSLENKYKNVVFKNLNWLWKSHPDLRLPWQKGDYNETNTVLLDDSPYKALLNPPYTAIFPYSYDHHNRRDASLGPGGDLRLYLEKLAGAENVQEFIKENPFGQEAITKASKDWQFYKKVIAEVRS